MDADPTKCQCWHDVAQLSSVMSFRLLVALHKTVAQRGITYLKENTFHFKCTWNPTKEPTDHLVESRKPLCEAKCCYGGWQVRSKLTLSCRYWKEKRKFYWVKVHSDTIKRIRTEDEKSNRTVDKLSEDAYHKLEHTPVASTRKSMGWFTRTLSMNDNVG